VLASRITAPRVPRKVSGESFSLTFLAAP